MDDIRNIDTLELATALYNLACDLDAADYSETAETEINEIENALYNIKVSALSGHNKENITLFNCLARALNIN